MDQNLAGLSLKQLKKMCKDAGLKMTGNKHQLIERLEFSSAQTKLKPDELLKRVRELENTVAQMEAQGLNNSDHEISLLETSCPRTSGFRPQGISSPCTTVVDSAAHPAWIRVPSAMPTQIVPPPGMSAQANVFVPSQATSSSITATSVPVYIQPQNAVSSMSYYVPTSSMSAPCYALPPTSTQYVHVAETRHDTTPDFTHTVNTPVVSFAAPLTRVVPPVFTSQQPNYQMAMPCASAVPSMNIRDIISVLPDFDPMDDGSLSSRQFVLRVQTLKLAYKWPDDLLIFAVQQRMKGHAKLWVDAQQEVFLSWQQFAELFVEAFPSDDNPASVHAKMSRLKRSWNETPQSYYYKMVALGMRFGLPECAVARYIINGINDFDLKKKISNDYYRCVDLLRDIDAYCRYNQIRTSVIKPPVVSTAPINSLPAENKRVKCYSCAQYGHIAAKCPNKAQPKPEEKKRVNQIEAKREATDEITKVVKVGGREVKAFVDPGSARTLIRASVAGSLGEISKCQVTLDGFGGGVYVAQSQLSADVAMDNNVFQTKLLIVDDKWMHHDALIGRDVICQRGKRVIFEDDECWMENVKTIATRTTNLNDAESGKLENIVASNRDCFAENAAELGTCSIKKMNIVLTSPVPINLKPYRVAFSQREKVRDMIDELLQARIIRESKSPYASPVVIVPKKNKELRLCVDYRQLNRVTVREPFPMPIIEEQMTLLADHVFFTTVDLRMGYHQIELEENAKQYTAFVTCEGHYEYQRMPFGLVNAPSVFQSVMNTIAAKLPRGEIITYLDDVVIPSKTVDEGLQRLEHFLDVLRDSGLTLRLDKCKFLAKQITYLGHDISAKGITPGEHTISAVKNFSTPQNVTEVRRFLGLTGFFRKFIQDYAFISRPLTTLLHKSEEGHFRWEPPQEEAFNKLIEVLCNKPVLTLYKFDASHEVHTDASAVGLAGVLLQSNDEKSWQPVFFFSRQCTDVESRYHAYELEVLAAVETLTRFRLYLLGKPFKLVTDCASIAKIKETKEMLPKISRWYLKLLEFDFQVVHRPANRLAHVDALSRAPNEPPRDCEPAGFIRQIAVGSDDWLLTMQLKDDKLRHIIAVLQGKEFSDQAEQLRADYQLLKSRLYRRQNGNRFVVPKSVRWRIVKACHDDVGHFGLDKTIARITDKFWFPRIRKYAKEYIASCVECCYNKVSGGKAEGRLYYGEVEPTPFSTLHLDHLGPFIKSARGMSYVLVISDAFTKYLVVKAVRNTKTGPVIATLNDLTMFFGLPKRIITDRGTAFTAKVFESYCGQNHIQHIKTAVRTPRANGQAERANQMILTFLRTTTVSSKNWDLHLRELQWSINTQRNATSGFAPNQLVFDFNLRDLTQNHVVAAIHEDQFESELLPMAEKRAAAAQHIEEARKRWKDRFDNFHKQPTEYKENDLVVVSHEPPATGESRKLAPKYRGPYIVTKVLGNDRYAVGDIPGMQITQRRFDSVYVADKMKRWCDGSPELEPDISDSGDSDTSIEGDADGRKGRAVNCSK